MREDRLASAASIISEAQHLIALTGAGISKESNVPTFRGKDGLWRKYNVMDLATPSAFARNPKLVWEWYSWRQDLIAKCTPNPAHHTLVKWELEGVLKALISQNVDGLHRRAGSTNVLEVHGNLWAIKCISCSHYGRLSSPAQGIPKCPSCGAHLRPDVVWFGETLDPAVMQQVRIELERADTIIVIGTSALVHPAASFPLIVKERGGRLIEVNIENTPLTRVSDVHVSGKAGEVLPQLDTHLNTT